METHRRLLFFKWLRRMHGWIGLWGAALGLLFGSTGFLLNHRAVMKIPAAHSAETQVQVPLLDAPASPDALARQLAQQFGYGEGQFRARREGARQVVWGGQTVTQPERWNVSLDAHDRYVRGEYWVGNRFVSLKLFEPNLFSILIRLHTSASGHGAWILLADTLAGGLVFLALSGLLLWTRMHRGRLVAAGVALAGLGATVTLALTGMAIG